MKLSPTKTRPLGTIARPRRLLDAGLLVAAMVAATSLVLEYGFHVPPVPRPLLHALQVALVATFVLDRVLRLWVAPERIGYLRENLIEFVVMVVAVLVLVVGAVTGLFPATPLHLVVVQGYIVMTLVLRSVSINLRLASAGVDPPRLLVAGFALLCVVGSLLLMLPAARPIDAAEPTGYVDALFTAVSATCVTGLVVLDTGLDWAGFGQMVILVLIQLGGLGIMTFGTILALLMRRGLGPRESAVLGEVLGADSPGRVGRVVKFVIATTLSIEIIGAVMLYPMFRQVPGADGQALSMAQAAWYSVFHSISAFCNAGFSLYSQSLMQGVHESWPVPLRERMEVLGVFAPLIVLGGIGFPVLQDLTGYVRGTLRRWWQARRRIHTRRPTLSLHSKLALATSAILLVIGALGLLVIEPTSGQAMGGAVGEGAPEVASWQTMGLAARLREAIFQSVTARTAGFNTIDMGGLSNAGKLWMCLLMLIGGGPASTAGGMKVTTFALLMMTVHSALRNRGDVELFHRSASGELLRRATTLAVLYLSLVTLVTLLLTILMREHAFIDLFFEAASACGTVGLSTGVTGELTTPAKGVVIVGMFAGRLGMLTILLALYRSVRPAEYAYPTEDIVLG